MSATWNTGQTNPIISKKKLGDGYKWIVKDKFR